LQRVADLAISCSPGAAAVPPAGDGARRLFDALLHAGLLNALALMQVAIRVAYVG
jgi:hypothetical protein